MIFEENKQKVKINETNEEILLIKRKNKQRQNITEKKCKNLKWNLESILEYKNVQSIPHKDMFFSFRCNILSDKCTINTPQDLFFFSRSKK